MRPIRLSESTRRFAADSLAGKYGAETGKIPTIPLDHIKNFSALSPLDQYDLAIEAIAAEAPIRFAPEERISGSASLGAAILHKVPATFGGKPIFSSISHLTLDFGKILRKGYTGLYEEIRSTSHTDPEKQRFLQSCLHCVRQMERWHQRYLNHPDLPEQARASLARVPRLPAETFAEAVQSLWFTFAFTRLCGNWPGIGRIDQLLGDYLEKDLAAGIITLNEARELLAHFFIKGCEWVGGNRGDAISGDAQHYQNIVLAGIDENGRPVTNAVTYLVLDILEETGISDFPTTVRIHKNTDPALLKRISQVIRLGGGVVAVYNEDLILDSLTQYGYPLKEARQFANDGCWEVQIPGKTYFKYIPFDGLKIFQSVLQEYPDYATLYQAYLAALRQQVEHIFANELHRQQSPKVPCTVVSLLEEGCIQKGRSYLDGGPVYQVVSPHIGGLADVTNSLYAIKKLVFEEQKISFSGLLELLKQNWEGNEALRRYAANHYVYYGNGNEEVDAIYARLVDDFSACCQELDGRIEARFPAGASTFGRQIEWAPHRTALPYGIKAGTVLAGNNSPTPGTDTEGATAVIRSYCRADLRKLVTGAALDLLLQPNTDAETITGLIQGFCALGGYFMQIDLHNPALLREAQQHPEQFRNLSVRVSGWNARFVTLNREWQDMIIERNFHS